MASPPPPDTVSEYHPAAAPGSRAPHAWLLGEGRSTVDLFGRGFVLMRVGDGAPDPSAIERAFAERGVPLTITSIAAPKIAELYARKLVLVRPDGHVAWRSDAAPADLRTLVDRVRGAS